MTGRHAADAAVLVPARNEAEAIRTCLDHVLAQDIGRDRLEVIVVDGDSADGTGEAAAAILADAGLRRWVVHRNPGGSTPSNLNAGLALVQAPVVCRVDARSLVPSHHVRRCVSVLDLHPDVVVVGGAQVAEPWSGSDRDLGIARALNNRYGMGLSRYRRGGTSGPSDTVYLGSFRTEELRAAGGWDERFGTNQDFELNRRMAALGTVWFDDSLQVGYLPRRSVRELWAQYHRFGRWKVRYWRMTGDRPQRRQMLLLAGSLGGAAAGVSALLSPATRKTALPLAFGGACLVELAGSQSPVTRRPAAHLVAIASMGAIASGWTAGVVRGLIGDG